ncbi:hypothetical protein PSPO01_03041 [Paraphaeosphaeria sporulosa]
MCKFYLQTVYCCRCHGHPNLPGRICAYYRHSLTAAHSKRGTGDVTSRPCISVAPMIPFKYACPQHRGSQDYWFVTARLGSKCLAHVWTNGSITCAQ